MKAMILAAGRGRRLRPLSDNIPKPLVKVGGKRLIARHLHHLKVAGCGEVVINVSHLGDKIVGAVGGGEAFGLTIRYSREKTPLETAGGIARALPLLGNAPFIAVNADIFFAPDFAAVIARAGKALRRKPKPLAYLVLVDNPAHNRSGDFALDADGFVRLPKRNQAALTFSGVAVYQPAFFDGVDPRRKQKIYPLLARAAKQGRVCGEYAEDEWRDLGTIQRLRALRAALSRKRRRKNGKKSAVKQTACGG